MVHDNWVCYHLPIFIHAMFCNLNYSYLCTMDFEIYLSVIFISKVITISSWVTSTCWESSQQIASDTWLHINIPTPIPFPLNHQQNNTMDLITQTLVWNLKIQNVIILLNFLPFLGLSLMIFLFMKNCRFYFSPLTHSLSPLVIFTFSFCLEP